MFRPNLCSFSFYFQGSYRRKQRLESYHGFKLRSALKGEPWTLVSEVPRGHVASEGVMDTFDILDQKYGVDVEQEKFTYLDEFFRVERGREGSVKGYVKRFQLIFRKCDAVRMEDMKENYKGGLLMTRAYLEGRDKNILPALWEVM